MHKDLHNKRILLVFGTRPEAIKMAPVIKELLNYPKQFDVKICVTAQHREMLDPVLKIFEIIPDYDLNIMVSNQDLYDINTRVLLAMRKVLIELRPNIILVQGDTTTTMAAALAAFYLQIPVGHIEAGLRTREIYSPFPEEMNRQITTRLAKYHFAPTLLNKYNLLSENIKEKNIFITGNTVIDALYWSLARIKKNKKFELKIKETLLEAGIPKEKLVAWEKSERLINHWGNNEENKRKMILITGHRRENFGKGFINICSAIKKLSVKFPETDFVYPMHLNPNVRSAIQKVFKDIRIEKNIIFIEPLDYLPFIYLLNSAYLVLTDSGGLQEEAPALGKPVLVMRDTTERPEGIKSGTVKLVGTNKNKIINSVSLLLNDFFEYNKMSKATNPYGNGKASKKIVATLLKLI